MTTKIALTNIADTALATLTGPKITTIVYPGTETATDTAGGETINLTGAGFQSGCNVLIGSTAASVVSFISSTQISFTAPAMSANTYVIYVINPDGGTAISIPGISYSGTPNWTTAAGTLGTTYETGAISATLTATGDAPITYALATGTLPPGSTLNSNGTLSGTAQATASATTYSFTIKASDAQNQTTNRNFSLTINPDVVTFSTPADSTTYNVFKDALIANVAMSATSAAGGSITYTADTLPTGLSISGANIQGTPTVVASTTTVLTATATSTRTATRTINWVVSIANDTFWKNTTLLLNGETTATPFIADASTNNFGLVINGDTKANKFSPYYGDGYYSNYFDGTGDYVTTPSDTAFAFGTGDFTMECWIYPMSTVTAMRVFEMVGGDNIDLNVASTGTISYYNGSTSTTSAAGLVNINNWYHIALVRSSGTAKVYVNGVLAVTQATTPNTTTARVLNIGGVTNVLFVGYISNVRVVKGTSVYTAAFTPSTTPLAAITNTVLLTCQSNRFIDKSTNNFTITKNGDTLVSSVIPFAANSSYSTYGSAYFDGTGDYLTLPASNAYSTTGDVTIETWIYTTSLQSTNYILDILSGATLGIGNLQVGITATGAARWYYDATSLITTTLTISTNSWNHIAFVRNGTTLKIYINGVADATTATFAGLIGRVDLVAYIGSSRTPANFVNGYLSEFRFTKAAIYTTTFTPPTAPLTAVANTQLLTLQYNGGANNSGFIDNSNFNNIITRFGNTSQGTFSPYSQTGWSNYFGSTSDYLQIPSTSLLLFGTGDFTIEAWVYHQGTAPGGGVTNDRFIFGRLSTVPNCALFLTNDTLRPAFWDGTNQRTSSSGVTPNTWTHVSVNRISNNIYFSVNGVVDQQSTSSINFVTASVFNIGRNDAAADRAFPGYISNLRVLKGTGLYSSNFTPSTSPLTPVTNTALLTCQTNRLIDNSPNNFVLTVSGTPSVQAFSPFGSIREATPLSYSNLFNGSTDYLTAPASAGWAFGSGDFTVEAWVYFTSTPSTTNQYGIVANQASGDNASWTLQSYNGNFRWVHWSGGFVIAGSTVLVQNKWYHVAVARLSGVVTMYVNGVSDGTVTGTQSYTTNAILYIGNGNGSGYFPGYISNVRILKGTALYTSAFTPPTTPLTAVANTQILTCQSTTMIDNSTNALTITATGSPKVYKYNPFGYTAQSSVSYTPSLHGGSAYFDGTGDYLTGPSNPILAIGTNQYTVEMWLYFTSVTATNEIFRTSTDSTSGRFTIYYNAGSLSATATGGAGATTASYTFITGQWYHVAASRDASNNQRLFVNGVLLATSTSTNNYSQTGFALGVGQSSGNMNGYITDLRVVNGTALYNSAFIPPAQPLTSPTSTPASLLLNFTNGGIIDQHSSNTLETVGNAQLSTSVKKYNTASMYFDGTGDYCVAPVNALYAFNTADFTIEAWIYRTDTGVQRGIVDTRDNSSVGALFYITTNNKLNLFDGTTTWITSTNTVTANQWVHVAVARASGTTKMFINGAQEASAADTRVYTAGSAGLYIGRQYGSTTNDFMGYIDDLRITKGYARYTAAFTAPTSALITK